MNCRRACIWIFLALSAALIFPQAAPKKGALAFVSYLMENKATLQYKSFETLEKGDKIEIKVYCQDVTQNKLIDAIERFVPEKYYFEMPTPGNIVFTAIFPSTYAEGAAAEPEKAAAATAKGCKGRIKVLASKILPGAFDQFAYFSGKVENQLSDLNAAAAGIVAEINVNTGDRVKASQVLAVLQAASKEEIAKLEAAAAKARKAYNAQKNAKPQDEQALKKAEESYQQAAELVKQKKEMLALPLVAPCNGVIKAITVAAGDKIIEGALIATIENSELLIGTVNVATEDLPLFSERETISAIFPKTGATASLQIAAIRDKAVTVTLDNTSGRFAGGNEVTFKKLKKHHDQALVLPAEWIQRDDIGAFIYVVDNKEARQMRVITGPTEDKKTLIPQGLTPGMEVIGSNFACLKDGKKISVIRPEEVKPIKIKPPRAERKAVPAEPFATRFRLGIVFGRFSVSDKNLKDFFGKSSTNAPGAELSFQVYDRIDLWASYKVYQIKGVTSEFQNEIKFRINPIFAGLRYRFQLPKAKKLEPFAGAGLNFYSYSESIYGETQLENTKGTAMGFHVQAGGYYNVWKPIFLSAFARLNLVKKTLAEPLPDETNKLNLGGLEFGIGLHYRF